MRHCISGLLLMLLASTVLAGPPVQGTYKSTDLGGLVLTGNFSESWLPGGGHGQPGNTVSASSWDGTALGTQWRLWCPAISTAPVLTSDTRNGDGTGDVTYRTTYIGGAFWFSGAGPWGDGTNDYTGTLQGFIVTAVYHFAANQLTGIESRVSTSGSFDGYSQCLEYSINSATFAGTTEYGAKPAVFPEFIAADCNPTGLERGAWGTVQKISVVVLHCRVELQPSAWTAVKRLYQP